MLKIRIETKNVAFHPIYPGEEFYKEWGDDAEECARILEEAIKKLRSGEKEFMLWDINGNIVGKGKLTKR